MPEEGFLRRWARMKASGGEAVAEARSSSPPPAPAAPAPAPVPVSVAEPAAPTAPERPAPTLEDAARLTHDSDYSAFVSQAVDKDVRRLALKKLFSDPHFNVLDRLDMYMDDYNKPDPVSATMLAALDHARGVLRRPEEVQAELQRLALGATPAEAEAPDEIAAGDAAQEAAVAEPGADTIEAADPDKLAQFQPTAGSALPAQEQAGTPVALQSPDAHNAETQP